MTGANRRLVPKRFFTLTSLEGIAAIVFLLGVPAEGTGVFLGFSLPRLALLSVLIGLTAASVWVTIHLFRGTAWGEAFEDRIRGLFNKRGTRLAVLYLAIVVVVLVISLAYLWGYSGILDIYKVVFTRLAPFVLWFGLVCLSLVVVLPGRIFEHKRETTQLVASLVILSVGLLVYLFLVNSLWPFTVDDAFITFRYSDNLVRGIGPTYNASPPRVEGYTNFLWMLLAALPLALGIDLLFFIKTLSVLAMLALLAVIFLAVIRLATFLPLASRLLLASVAVFMQAVYPPTATHTVSGMETALFTLLLALFVYLMVGAVQGDMRALKIAPVVGLLLGLTRPEGNLPVLLLLGAAFFLLAKETRKKLALSAGLGYVLPGAVYYLWRYSYYGLLFPLPFYAKVVNPSGVAGVVDVWGFSALVLPFLGVFLFAALVRLNRGIALLAGSALVMLLFYLFPAHVMGFSFRYVFPTLPLLFALAGYGLAVIVQALQGLFDSKEKTARATLALAVWVSAIAGVYLMKDVNAEVQEYLDYDELLRKAHIRLGKALGEFEVDPANPPVLAMADAGAGPYYSRWETVDMLGLNDIRTADPNATNFLGYLFEQDPSIIAFASYDKEVLVRDGTFSDRLYQACLDHGYVKLYALRANKTYYLWVIGKPDSDVAAYLGDVWE